MLIQRSDKDDCIDPAKAIEVGVSNRRHWFLVNAAEQTSPLHLDQDD
jgi:hypothetical protein